ncbi:MAG: hypothetical protein SCK28_09940 [Bacillota bacterium]|nr:hypothetical protein [Bacillota bacterium]
MLLIFNIVLFTVIFNFSYISDRIKGKNPKKSFQEMFILPVMLGAVLTIADNLRIFFIYKLLIFIILGLVVYIALKKYGRR